MTPEQQRRAIQRSVISASYQTYKEDGITFLVAPCGCPDCDQTRKPGHDYCDASPDDLLALEQRNVPVVSREFIADGWRWFFTDRA